MDEKSSDLVRKTLDIYQRELGPQYEALRAQVAGRIAAESVIYEHEQALANAEMIGDMLYQLPTMSEGGKFIVKDEATFRGLQASLVWMSGWRKAYRPYYILGENLLSQSDDATSSLLLVEPRTIDGQEEPLITALTLPLKSVVAITEHHPTRLSIDTRKEVLKASLSSEGTSFIVDDSTEGNLGLDVLRNKGGSGETRKANERIFNPYITFKKPYKSTKKRILTSEEMTDQVTFGDYHVVEYLHKLALTFGVVDAFDRIFEERQKKATTYPEELSI